MSREVEEFANAATRGVDAADRASALAGVPQSTMYYWARRDLLPPSVSSEKLKLWSWADLVALRAVYWLRHPGTLEHRKPTKMSLVRDLIQEVESQAGKLGDAISSRSVILRVDRAGIPYLETGDIIVEARHVWKQQVASDLMVDLLSPFSAEGGIRGPHLLRPRPELRIIPGKLAGEPHIRDTRIETRVLWTLRGRGYSAPELVDLYGDISLAAVNDAIDLESELQQNAVAA